MLNYKLALVVVSAAYLSGCATVLNTMGIDAKLMTDETMSVCDTNKDNYITVTEYSSCSDKPEEAAAEFSEIDKNQDKKASRDEIYTSYKRQGFK